MPTYIWRYIYEDIIFRYNLNFTGQDNQKSPQLYYVENGEDLGVSKTFRILYRHEEIMLDDIILFKAHVLVDSQKVN